ncbi:MAG: ComEC/Rec2 family competence protein [Fimbriimonadales bacterium]
MRTELERRPLFVAALGLILGLTLVLHPIHLLFLLPAPWILQSFKPRAVLAVGLLVGAILGPGPDPPLIEDQYVTGRWTVATMPQILPDFQSCAVAQGQNRLLLYCERTVPLCPGSVIQFTGVAKPPKEGREAQFRLRSLLGSVYAQPGSLRVVEDGPWVQRLACGWRERFMSLAAQNLPASAAAAEDSMCFRVNGLMDEQSRTEIVNSGTMHLMVSSGLQAILIGHSLLWLLMWLPIPRWVQLVLVGFVLTLYAIATGSSPTIIRVAIMSMIAYSAYLFRREPDWPSALAASSILYLVWNPNGVYEIGFQLSSIAVLFISMFSETVKWKPGLEAWLYRTARRSVRTAMIAYVVITPLLAHFFGTVSLVMVPAGLLLIVLSVPIVMLAMTALPVSLLLPSAGGIVIKSTIPLMDLVFRVLGAFGGDQVSVIAPPFSPYWLVPFYALLLLLWRPFIRRS